MVNQPITYEFSMFTKAETELQETDKLTMNLLQYLVRSVEVKDGRGFAKKWEREKTGRSIRDFSGKKRPEYKTPEYTKMFMEVFRDDFLFHLHFDFDHTEETECVDKITTIVEYLDLLSSKFGDYSISGYTKFESVSQLDFKKSHYIMELRDYGEKNLSFHVIFYESVCYRYSLVVPIRDRFNMNSEFEYDPAIYTQGQHSFKPTFSEKPGGTTKAINPKLFPGDIGNYICQPAIGEYNYVSDVFSAFNNALASKIDNFKTRLTLLPPPKPIYDKSAKEAEMMDIDKDVITLLNEIEYYYDIEEDFYNIQTLIKINGMEDGKLDV
jgi:hypothetical protein